MIGFKNYLDGQLPFGFPNQLSSYETVIESVKARVPTEGTGVILSRDGLPDKLLLVGRPGEAAEEAEEYAASRNEARPDSHRLEAVVLAGIQAVSVRYHTASSKQDQGDFLWRINFGTGENDLPRTPDELDKALKLYTVLGGIGLIRNGDKSEPDELIDIVPEEKDVQPVPKGFYTSEVVGYVESLDTVYTTKS